MIADVGPQPRLVQFFEKICDVAGKPIKANQERCLRKLWMDRARRSRTLIEASERASHRARSKDPSEEDTRLDRERTRRTRVKGVVRRIVSRA